MKVSTKSFLWTAVIGAGLLVGSYAMDSPKDENKQRSLITSQGPWLECIGLTGEACVALIQEAAPALNGKVYIVPPDSFVTMDYDITRVRVWVNEQGIVEQAPSRG